MNEAETPAEHSAPVPRTAGRGIVEGSKILREHRITAARIEGHGRRGKPEEIGKAFAGFQKYLCMEQVA